MLSRIRWTVGRTWCARRRRWPVVPLGRPEALAARARSNR
jgi:hypothetical protein